jgi:hypothetical protein
MSYCYNGKDIFDDKNIYEYIINISQQTYPGPLDFETFKVWTSPGFTFYDSSNASVAILSIEDIVAICCIINNRTYYWYLYVDQSRFEYDNFMFGMKYPVLANLVYNLYHDHFENPILLNYILYQTSWKIFPIHKIFCSTFELTSSQRIYENTNLIVLELWMDNYGKCDDNNYTYTSTEMYDYKPYDVKTIQEYQEYKLIKKHLMFRWEIIKEYLRIQNIDFIMLEQLLCCIRSRFLEEPYKFIEIALDTDRPELYKWVVRKYKIDKSRILKTLDHFIPNKTTQLIKIEM